MGALARPHKEENCKKTYQNSALQVARPLHVGLGEGLEPFRPASQAVTDGVQRLLLLGLRPEDNGAPTPRRLRHGSSGPSLPGHQGVPHAGRLRCC